MDAIITRIKNTTRQHWQNWGWRDTVVLLFFAALFTGVTMYFSVGQREAALEARLDQSSKGFAAAGQLLSDVREKLEKATADSAQLREKLAATEADKKLAEGRADSLSGDKWALEEFIEKFSTLLAHPKIVADRLLVAGREALALDPSVSPAALAIAIRLELGAHLTKAVARYAFAGGVEHFNRLAAFVAPGLKAVVAMSPQRAKELAPILSTAYNNKKVKELGEDAVFACSTSFGGDGHDSPKCKEAEKAEAAFWGLTELSADQRYLLNFLNRRAERGDELANAVRLWLASHIVEPFVEPPPAQ